MPRGIDEAFQSAKVSLFPARRADLVTSCSCPDWGDPCKHVAATHYILGEELDRDPFLLFELRGRTKTQVIDALRRARSGEDESVEKTHDANAGAEASSHVRAPVHVPGVSLGTLTAADYDRPREALPALHFSFDAPLTHGAVLRQLGAPAVWRGEGSPADTLSPILRRAAEAARRIAMAEPAVEAVTEDSQSTAERRANPAIPARSGRARRRGR